MIKKRVMKFRSWHEDNKEMVYPDYDYFYRPELACCDNQEDSDVHVMQWTGYKDKNGVDVYEGDLLNVHTKKNNCPHYVEFTESWWLVPAKDDDEIGCCMTKYAGEEVFKSSIIVGNVYER